MFNDSSSFFGSSPSANEPLSIWLLQKIAEMGTECTPVSSCVIEVDVLLSQTTFYDVKNGEESFIIQNSITMT